MNTKLVAKSTIQLISSKTLWPYEPRELNRGFILQKLEQIESGEFSQLEATYWLGWAQAACLAAKIPYEEIQKINQQGELVA